jgi:hypothetical protein
VDVIGPAAPAPAAGDGGTMVLEVSFQLTPYNGIPKLILLAGIPLLIQYMAAKSELKFVVSPERLRRGE